MCYDTLFHEAVTWKEDKYLDLLSAIRKAGYNAKLITVEVGSRGLPNMCGFDKLRKELKLTRTSWSKQQREQCWAHLLYGAIETVFISNHVHQQPCSSVTVLIIILFVCGLCLNTLFSTCGLEPSVVCNVFCRTFSPIDLGVLHPSLVCICIVANPMKSFTHTGGREGGREGGKTKRGKKWDRRGRKDSHT